MSSKNIHFSQHARIKFEILRNHGLNLDKEKIIAVMIHPDIIIKGYPGRKIAQGLLDERRVLRVVYEEKIDEILIITFYPGKRERYEKS